MDATLFPLIKQEPDSDNEVDPLALNIDLREVKEEDGDHDQRLLPNYVEDSVSNRINNFEVKEEISVDEDGIHLHSVDTVVCDNGFCNQQPACGDSQIICGTYMDQRTYARKRFAHICDECGKGFITPSKLKRHTLAHTGEKPHMCELCMRRFKSVDHLKRHSIIHSEVKAYNCLECSKRFSRLDRLKAHSLIHFGNKPYECNECYKSFINRSTLRRHALIHTGEKPLMCIVCSKRFSHRTALERHALTHTGEKPYVCKICDVGFIRLDYLKTHIASHSGEKSYICKICSKGFTSCGVLKKHTLIHTAKYIIHQSFICSSCQFDTVYQNFMSSSKLHSRNLRAHSRPTAHLFIAVCGIFFKGYLT